MKTNDLHDSILQCGCGSKYMHNVTEYIIPGNRNREKNIIIITECEECSKLNSFSFNFWKGTIQIKHFYGDIVKEAISEDNELSKLY